MKGQLVLGLIGGAAALLFGRKVLQLNSLSNNVIVDTAFRIHKVQLFPPQIIVAADAVIKNPSNGQVKIKHPVVSIYVAEADLQANKPIITSDVINKDYQIPQQGMVKLDPILLTVPILKVGSTLAANISSGQPWHVWTRIGTMLNNAIALKFDQKQTIRG